MAFRVSPVFLIIIVQFAYIQSGSRVTAQGIDGLEPNKYMTPSNKFSVVIRKCAEWAETNNDERKQIYMDIKRFSDPGHRLMDHRTGCVVFCVLLSIGFFIPNDKGLVSISRSATLEHSLAFFHNVAEEAYGHGIVAETFTKVFRECFPDSGSFDVDYNCRIWKDTTNCMKETIEKNEHLASM